MGILFVYDSDSAENTAQASIQSVLDVCQQQGLAKIYRHPRFHLLETSALPLAVSAALQAAPCDYAWFPEGLAEVLRIRVCAMDMDSTVINIECIDEIARFAGCAEAVKAITEATMRGEIQSFRDSLIQRVALLKGVPVGALESIYSDILQFNPGVQSLVAGFKKRGIACILLSGGFTFFTDRVREAVGFDAAFANVLEVEDGVLTGKVLGSILDAEAKKQHLEDFCRAQQVPIQQSIAIGDGANDLKMLAASGFGVAYRAKPVVQEQADFALNVQSFERLLDWFIAAEWIQNNHHV